MNPLNIVNLVSDIIDSLAETTPARLRRKSVWHKRRALHWGDKMHRDKTPKRRQRARDKYRYHNGRAELYSREASEMEERDDD